MKELIYLGGGAASMYLAMRYTKIFGDYACVPLGESPALTGPTSEPNTSTSPTDDLASKLAPLIQLSGRWVWPVPRWQGRAPVISDGYGSQRGAAKHLGVDIMFLRTAADPFPIGPNGTKLFVMPDHHPAVAASDGVLWSAGLSTRGWSIVVDHDTVATFYQHLSEPIVPVTKPPPLRGPNPKPIPIRAGQPLGIIGADPTEKHGVKHLHFEVWPHGPASAADPAPVMKSWGIVDPAHVSTFLAATRNAKRTKSEDNSDLVEVRHHFRSYPGTALRPG